MPIACKFKASAIGGPAGVRFLLDHPIVLLFVLLAIFWSATRLGAVLRAWLGPLDKDKHGDFDLMLGATLTLLSLIVGFSFSMAGNRYDQRKNLEEDEANAIGTAYARADLLPAADAAKVKGLLREYAYIARHNDKGKIDVEYLDIYQNRKKAEDLGIEQPNVVVLISGEHRRVLTMLDFYVDFEFKSKLLQSVMAMLFNEAVRLMVRAFERRAYVLYRRGTPPAAAPAPREA